MAVRWTLQWRRSPGRLDVRGAVVLVVLSDAECEEFIREDIAGYAEQLSSEKAVSPEEATDRANTELRPRLRQEHATAVANGHQRFTAVAADGNSVGWLWVTPPEVDMPPDSAFLYQILVKPQCRRQGFGRAMLAALEQSLASDGVVELRLNVFDTNRARQAALCERRIRSRQAPERNESTAQASHDRHSRLEERVCLGGCIRQICRGLDVVTRYPAAGRSPAPCGRYRRHLVRSRPCTADPMRLARHRFPAT